MVEARSVNVKNTTTTTNRDPNRDKKLCDSTSDGTDNSKTVHQTLFTPYREQPRSTRIVVAYRYIASRARSLRNLLVSGNECGRVFPAGVGPGSPSRDAANWLPSRFSLSVETRRRYGWLRMMVFPGARLFPSPNLVPFGRVAARERQGALSRRAW